MRRSSRRLCAARLRSARRSRGASRLWRASRARRSGSAVSASAASRARRSASARSRFRASFELEQRRLRRARSALSIRRLNSGSAASRARRSASTCSKSARSFAQASSALGAEAEQARRRSLRRLRAARLRSVRRSRGAPPLWSAAPGRCSESSRDRSEGGGGEQAAPLGRLEGGGHASARDGGVYDRKLRIWTRAEKAFVTNAAENFLFL